MSPIRSILAASDFSISAAGAAQRAARLAREHLADLQLLHVVPSEALSEFREISGNSVYLEQQLLEDAQRRLEALGAAIQPIANRTPVCLTRAGDVLEEILTAADRADLLVLGSHGSRPSGDLLIGTIVGRLLRSGRRPTLVVRQEAIAPYRRVMVAVDFSMQSTAALHFALRIAPAADLLIFHAYERPYDSELRRAAVPDETIERFHTNRRNQVLSNMEGLRDRAGVPDARATLVVECASAKTRVAAKAAELGADLIVVGKHGRSLIAELLLGGVTRHTVARAGCDVAVVPEYPRL